MKKKSKIKVLRDIQNNDNYTFIMDVNLSSTHNSEVDVQSKKEVEENSGATDIDNLDKIYKKKKVLTNEDVRKASKGLKFSNPSQRNHSSIYE
jgi:hypothetical protein